MDSLCCPVCCPNTSTSNSFPAAAIFQPTMQCPAMHQSRKLCQLWLKAFVMLFHKSFLTSPLSPSPPQQTLCPNQVPDTLPQLAVVSRRVTCNAVTHRFVVWGLVPLHYLPFLANIVPMLVLVVITETSYLLFLWGNTEKCFLH